MHLLSLGPLRPKPPAAFDEKKAAEVAAFFTLRERGVSDVLKLAKLLYLAERESYRRYGRPLIGDRLSSMPDGPVLSETLNYIRGHGRPPKAWANLFGPRDGNKLPLVDKDLTTDDLLRLSNADIELLEYIWEQFGSMGPLDAWRYVHDPKNVPEYENPGESSKPIKIDSLLTAVGYSTEQIREILVRLEEQDQFCAALKKAAV